MTAPRATARRLPLLAAAIGAVLVLAACTAAPDPSQSTASAARPTASAPATPSVTTPSATPTASATPAPSGSASAATERYLGFVQQFSPTLATIRPDVLVALGGRVCADFGRGRDAGQVATALGADAGTTGLQATDAAVVIGAAVATLCPQYRKRLAE